ncbi:hypothetical protein [Actinosynnema sp. NPDC020468]|uniref:hypothetical protein n=1 Tax=Actinosynnema sp. NPDC020468 TaxID=3154488 RepID=UPI00340693F5
MFSVVVALPLVVVVIGLLPVFFVGPFLSARHHRLLLRLVADLAAWTGVVCGVVSPGNRRR